jgi:hypothetical protein
MYSRGRPYRDTIDELHVRLFIRIVVHGDQRFSVHFGLILRVYAGDGR